MGRRCWRRRALAAACLGAALLLLLLGVAPRALRPGECSPAPGPPQRGRTPDGWGYLMCLPGVGGRAGGLKKLQMPRLCPGCPQASSPSGPGLPRPGEVRGNGSCTTDCALVPGEWWVVEGIRRRGRVASFSLGFALQIRGCAWGASLPLRVRR